MLIYANAVTQIWKRLLPLLGSWTEAWSSRVAPRAFGKSPAHWLNLYISVVNVYCSLKPGEDWKKKRENEKKKMTLYVLLSLHILFLFLLLRWESVPLGLNAVLGSVSGTVATKVGPWPSWRVPKVLLLLLRCVPLLSAQAGSRCGGVIGKKKKKEN